MTLSPPTSPPKSPPQSPPKSPPASPPASPPSTDVLPACATPDARPIPDYRLPYRHPLIVAPVLPLVAADSLPEFGCATVPSVTISVAFDPRYEQLWVLKRFVIGDLASTLNLAPLERLVIEVKTSQRTTLERSAIESSESLDSTEATLRDTDTVNVARSNTNTTNWHLDGQGGFSSPYGSLSAGAGYGKNLSNNATYAQTRTNERTQKSANSLKTLHKIEIRGASESIIQDRQLRTLRNPYRDRALALNFFQLLKYFDVTTSMTESRISVTVQIDDITMDQGFILANVDFLNQNLLDDSLRADLPFAVAGARSGKRDDQTPATLAQKALQFLYFNPPNIFNVPPGPNNLTSPNDPANTYNDSISTAQPNFGSSGMEDVLFKDQNNAESNNRPFATVFFTLNFFRSLVQDDTLDPNKNGENAIQLCLALYNAIKDDWEQAIKDSPIGFRNLLDNQDYTEGFRRVAGFLAMVGKLLLPLINSVVTTTTSVALDPTKPEDTTTKTVVAISDEETPRQRNSRVLDAFLAHLDCNKNYYVQRFLEYTARRTRGQAIVDFATRLWKVLTDANSPFLSADLQNVRNNVIDFDPAAAFIDKQTIVIPDRVAVIGLSSPVGTPQGLTATQLAQIGQFLHVKESSPPDPINFPSPATVSIQVPADGVHLEVAGGACILQDVPDKPFVQADLNFGPSSVSISEE